MAKKRRGNGEGTIRLRTDGRWEARATIPELGEKKCFYGRTRAEAHEKLITALGAIKTGATVVRDERLTVSHYLEDWLQRKRPDLRPNTWTRYRELLAHVNARFGDRQLTKLTPARLERLYADLMLAKPEGGAGLSSTTVHHMHVVLSQALADAERLGLVPRNVAERRSGAKPPRVRHVEMKTLTLEQARELLAAIQGDRLEALYVLALTTGMREGELLALRWRDVDLETAHLQVRGTLALIPGQGYHIGPPKTSRSRRRVDLSVEAVAALRRQKVRQTEEKLASGLGSGWGDSQWPDLVFTNQVGRCIDAVNLLKYHFRPLLRRAQLPAIRFHDLRHTAASLMALQGAPIKVVSELLGHSSSAFTIDRYQHTLPGMQKDAVAALERALFVSDSEQRRPSQM